MITAREVSQPDPYLGEIMTMKNKLFSRCNDCGGTLAPGEGLIEQRQVLGFGGSGWVGRHSYCDFKSTSQPPQRRYFAVGPALDYEDLTEAELLPDLGSKG